MSKRWYNEHRRDPWRRKAKSSGYRSRSAYKLLQCQEKFNLIREGDTILDVGCHPGGWSQVSVELGGGEGRVIGIDLKPCEPIPGVELLVGDITEVGTQDNLLGLLDGAPIHSIVSDISPGLTGQYEMDQAISLDLVCLVMDFSLPLLNKGGSFVTKVFQGRGIEAVVEAAKLNFSKVQRFSPVASRNSSSETYLVCKNKLPRTRGKDGDFSVRDYVEASLAKDGFVTSEDESDSEVSGKIGFTLHRARDD
ncbi:MAG TPA: RlmE family RNA methyltransferase [Candidatus Thalassarchaeaceae archaeon]|mgnify:FL=1|jgi:23S rRNA (uridine2552-2'-O)-methyltransferase|nr:RlmE family RNA methyltransferase [Candidatus Thalassarchaeaceae archaeon]HJL59942.1 RlmE family RNA methyltransferase [Candidatus Thalassarchaeaceae archaeon]HJM19730.1 RlmE family RNA methyltransferase [Candidatus Thalassarchaeaceae archaeon]HJM87328.1 RlmE family RNA methyltransferase [Candidatus Thalassarchaeaceae archaeon]